MYVIEGTYKYKYLNQTALRWYMFKIRIFIVGGIIEWHLFIKFR